MQLFREKDKAKGASFSLCYFQTSEIWNSCSATDEVRLCKKNIHQHPEKSKGKCSHPKYLLFMFKPYKKSLYYVLVFPSLFIVFLAANHPRMGKVPLDPSTSTKASTTSCCQKRTLVRQNSGLPQRVSQSAATLTIRNIQQLAPSVLYSSRKRIPLNYCHL